MKRHLLCLLLAATLCAGCNEKLPAFRYATENTAIVDGRFTGTNVHFYGTAVIADTDGNTHTEKDVELDFAGLDDNFVLYIHHIRLDATLPKHNLRIGSLTSIPDIGPKLAFSAASIVPGVWRPNEIGGGYSYQPEPAYTMTALDGTIDGIDCRVGFECDLPDAGVRRIEFQGKMIIEF